MGNILHSIFDQSLAFIIIDFKLKLYDDSQNADISHFVVVPVISCKRNCVIENCSRAA